MDSPKLNKTLKYNSHQQQQQHSMFSVVEPSPLDQFKSVAQNKSSFEDVSFSSYLKSKDPSTNSDQNNSSSPSDDAEISIFDAQKYFSESNDVKGSQQQQQQATNKDNLLQSVPRLSSVSSSVDGYGRILRTRSFHATPTASSEASWNSQTGLLANPPGTNGVSMRNLGSHQEKKRSSIARKWVFGRKCCCTGKKSVQVKEEVSGSDNAGQANNAKPKMSYSKRDCTMSPRSTITNNSLPLPQLITNSMHFSPENDRLARQRRVSATGRAFPDHIPAIGFSFPVLNPAQQAVKKGMLTTKTAVIGPPLDPPRESLEVFRPPAHRPGSPIPGCVADDDVGSDASSDLFEIESFSTKTTTPSYPVMYRRGDLLDDASTFNARSFASRTSLDEPATPSVAATECYAPSEVSIDWSVTTAEGFDRASVSNFSLSASEFGNEAYLRRRQEEEEEKRKGNNSGGGGGHHGGLLLMSCRHEKAVSVGPQPVKYAAAEGIYPVHVGGVRPPRGGGGASNSRLAFAA